MFDRIVPLGVLYEDDVLGIVSKPAKMLVHRTEIANGDTVFAVQCARETFGRKVWPVHRLDRGTSGVLVFAFDQETAGALGRQMMADGMKKRYAAVVRGTRICVHLNERGVRSTSLGS